jgi:hypothetical protein
LNQAIQGAEPGPDRVEQAHYVSRLAHVRLHGECRAAVLGDTSNY